MAPDLQQRSAQHDHRWDNTRYETENGRVVLQAEPIKNGGLPYCLLILIRTNLSLLFIAGIATERPAD